MRVTISDIKETSKAASAKAVMRIIAATLNTPTVNKQDNRVVLNFTDQRFYFYLLDQIDKKLAADAKGFRGGFRVRSMLCCGVAVFTNDLERKNAS